MWIRWSTCAGSGRAGAPELRAFLEQHRRIAVDTMIYIYFLEDVEPYSGRLQALFEAWEQGTHQGSSSILALLEILVRPWQLGRLDVVAEYRQSLMTYPNLHLLPVDADIAGEGARLRARHGCSTPDALHLATALHSGASAFLSNDRRLPAVPGLELVLLDELN